MESPSLVDGAFSNRLTIKPNSNAFYCHDRYIAHDSVTATLQLIASLKKKPNFLSKLLKLRSFSSVNWTTSPNVCELKKTYAFLFVFVAGLQRCGCCMLDQHKITKRSKGSCYGEKASVFAQFSSLSEIERWHGKQESARLKAGAQCQWTVRTFEDWTWAPATTRANRNRH